MEKHVEKSIHQPEAQCVPSRQGIPGASSCIELWSQGRVCIGIEVQATYKGIPVLCRFVREKNAAGTIFSLRFLNPTNLLLRQIEKDVATTGIPSPWMRGLPRLATTAKHLPVPVLAVVQLGAATLYMNVKNFTLGGLQLEYSGNEVRELTVGSRLDFDLVTNGGEKLHDISGIITHVTAEYNNGHGDTGKFQFGMKFIPMGAVSEMRYRAMIRAHCEGLKDAFTGEASAF